MRLSVEPDLLVVASATSAAAAELLIGAERPDVALLGETAPPGSAIRLVRRLVAANVRPVMLTFDDDPVQATAALLAGAGGFLPKDASAADLLRALRAAARGDIWVEPRILGGVLRRLAERSSDSPAAARLDRLTDRERAVLDRLAKGLDYGTTARELFLSPSTVRSHTRSVLAKLGARSVLEAVAIASGAERTSGEKVTGPAVRRSPP